MNVDVLVRGYGCVCVDVDLWIHGYMDVWMCGLLAAGTPMCEGTVLVPSDSLHLFHCGVALDDRTRSVCEALGRSDKRSVHPSRSAMAGDTKSAASGPRRTTGQTINAPVHAAMTKLNALPKNVSEDARASKVGSCSAR